MPIDPDDGLFWNGVNAIRYPYPSDPLEYDSITKSFRTTRELYSMQGDPEWVSTLINGAREVKKELTCIDCGCFYKNLPYKNLPYEHSRYCPKRNHKTQKCIQCGTSGWNDKEKYLECLICGYVFVKGEKPGEYLPAVTKNLSGQPVQLVTSCSTSENDILMEVRKTINQEIRKVKEDQSEIRNVQTQLVNLVRDEFKKHWAEVKETIDPLVPVKVEEPEHKSCCCCLCNREYDASYISVSRDYWSELRDKAHELHYLKRPIIKYMKIVQWMVLGGLIQNLIFMLMHHC